MSAPEAPAVAGTPEAPPPRLAATYWLCIIIEMWERLAYYLLRPVAAIYIMQATEPGGLHLTATHKGTIYAWWGLFQSILPMFTGGFADRYGYKRMLALSVTLNVSAYLLMAFTHGYVPFFAGILLLGSGTALFKPSIQATLGASLTKDNSSLGWGIFYWVVNVGSLIGHFLSPILLGKPHSADGWRMLFLACAGFTALNYLMLFTYRDVPSGASKTESFLRVVWRTLINMFDARLIAWLLIMSCFWMMMYQLWDTQPNFIEDWVDSSGVAAHMPFEKWKEVGASGQLQVPQQVLLSLNSIMIVCFMVPFSWLVRRMRTLSAMFFGMMVATVGVVVAGMTGNAWMLLLGIVFFSLGEMATGPKKIEYLSLIAPPGRKGLYLGYANIPVGIGQVLGSKIAGFSYGHYGEKATLALRYLMEKTPFGEGRAWDGQVTSLEKTLGVSRTEAFSKLQEVTGLDGAAATRLLWETYDPQYYVWLPFAVIGVIAAIALAIFGQMAKRWKDMNA